MCNRQSDHPSDVSIELSLGVFAQLHVTWLILSIVNLAKITGGAEEGWLSLHIPVGRLVLKSGGHDMS